jgi:hypothetical protein
MWVNEMFFLAFIKLKWLEDVLLDVLGRGSSGEVWRVQEIKLPGCYAALKIMFKRGHSFKARHAWELSEYLRASKSVKIGYVSNIVL